MCEVANTKKIFNKWNALLSLLLIEAFLLPCDIIVHYDQH